jgi:hypothetical protein
MSNITHDFWLCGVAQFFGFFVFFEEGGGIKRSKLYLMHSANYLSKKDSSTMLPELTEFVPATRMGIVRKVL